MVCLQPVKVSSYNRREVLRKLQGRLWGTWTIINPGWSEHSSTTTNLSHLNQSILSAATNERNEWVWGTKFFSFIWRWKTENVIMNNPPLANRIDKDVSTKTDNDLTDNDVTDKYVTVTATRECPQLRLPRARRNWVAENHSKCVCKSYCHGSGGGNWAVEGERGWVI